MTVLIALVGLSGLHVIAADPECPAGKSAYCCT